MTRWSMSPDRIPSAWYNVLPRLESPMDPPLHPGTRQPVGPDDLAPLFPMGLILQEVSGDPWIDIPGEVLDILRLWRPTPLVRATRLEQALGTPARIYFKDGRAKVEIGLARGKEQRDKRESLKRAEGKREIERVMKSRARNAR